MLNTHRSGFVTKASVTISERRTTSVAPQISVPAHHTLPLSSMLNVTSADASRVQPLGVAIQTSAILNEMADEGVQIDNG